MSEAGFWIACCVCVLVSGLALSVPNREVVEVACISALQLYIAWIGVKGLREKRADPGVLGERGVTVLVAVFALCSLGYLACSLVALFGGGDGPRNAFVEVSGGANLVLAFWYLVRYIRREREKTAVMAVPSIAVKYGLTKREEELLCMLVEGMSNQQIGSAAFISVGTVKAHAHNIYAKLGISGRSDLEDFVKGELDAPSERTSFWAPSRKRSDTP